MDHAGAFIDAVQTAAIIVMAAALIYVVWRLEGQFKAWGSTLHEVNKQLREQAAVVKEHEAVLDSLNTIWARINLIEKHVGIRQNDRS